MASRADLIMAQVRGELAQLNREKADTGNFIDDITAGVLGYQTGKELMDSLQDPINKIKTRRAKKNKAALMDKYSGVTTEQPDEFIEELDMFTDEEMIMEPIEDTGFDTYENSTFDKFLVGIPLPKPDRPLVKNTFTEEPELEPDMMLDEEKLPININIEDEVNKATELYLNGTTDTYLTDYGYI